MIIGTTYAYFTWQSSNNPIVDITVEDMADVVFKGGNDIDITDIVHVILIFLRNCTVFRDYNTRVAPLCAKLRRQRSDNIRKTARLCKGIRFT